MFALLMQQRDAVCRKHSRTLLSTLLIRNSHLFANKSVSGVKNVTGAARRSDHLRKILLFNLNRTDAIQSHSIIRVSQKI